MNEIDRQKRINQLQNYLTACVIIMAMQVFANGLLILEYIYG